MGHAVSKMPEDGAVRCRSCLQLFPRLLDVWGERCRCGPCTLLQRHPRGCRQQRSMAGAREGSRWGKKKSREKYSLWGCWEAAGSCSGELRSPRFCSWHLPARPASPRSPSRWRRGDKGPSPCLSGEGWLRSRVACAHPGHLPALVPAGLPGRVEVVCLEGCTEPVRGAAEECRQLDTRCCR